MLWRASARSCTALVVPKNQRMIGRPGKRQEESCTSDIVSCPGTCVKNARNAGASRIGGREFALEWLGHAVHL